MYTYEAAAWAGPESQRDLANSAVASVHGEKPSDANLGNLANVSGRSGRKPAFFSSEQDFTFVHGKEATFTAAG